RYATHLCYPMTITALLVVATSTSHRRRAISGLVTCQAFTTIAVLAYLFPVTRASETADIRQFAERVRQDTRPQACIALTEVGAFGFYSDRYVVDIIGLVDRAALEWLEQHGKVQDLASLEQILAARNANYYVDTFAMPSPVVGSRFDFVPIME